jgi:predicted kinase
MKQELVICRGIPASGKSTYAQAWVAAGEKRVRVNRDDIRFQMYGVYHGEQVNEELVTRVEDAMIEAALKQYNSAIVDDTNIKQAYVKRIADIGHRFQIPVEIKTFYISLDEALARNAARDRKVPEDVIRKMYQSLKSSGEVDITPGRVYTPDTYVPPVDGLPAILVDIDGTIAHNDGHRSFYDWMKVGGDDPIREVIDIVRWAYDYGYAVIVMSGRDGECREVTEEWLTEHKIPYDEFHMRAAGDQRKDSIVKRELFDAHVRPFYDVKFVLDDRDQVVDMWRQMGLRCLQVAPGNF